jgi:hypothetical protein
MLAVWRRQVATEYSECLADARVVILPDADDIGENHAKQVWRLLRDLTKRATIKRLPNVPHGGDAYDYFARGVRSKILGRLHWKALLQGGVSRANRLGRVPGRLKSLKRQTRMLAWPHSWRRTIYVSGWRKTLAAQSYPLTLISP